MRLLLIGHGRWGTKLLQRFTPMVDYVVVCDTRFIYDNPPGHFREYKKALAELKVDACIVATPPSSHFEIAKACLEAGKDVLVEKPMTLAHDEAVELCGLAQSKNLTLMTDDTFMYTDWVRQHFPDEEGNAFYKPRVDFVSARWSNPRAETPEEGILWTQGPHPVSIILRMMRRAPFQVSARTAGDRESSFRLRFDSGDSGYVGLTWRTNYRARQLTYGTVDGVGYFDFDELTQDPDPLTVMCSSFLARLGKEWVDHQGLAVVSTLQAVAEDSADMAPSAPSQNGHPA